MSDLSELFTGFREFVDQRQDQLIAVELAMEDLGRPSVDIGNFTQLKEYLTELNLYSLINQYHNKTNDMQRGNQVLTRAIRNINFNTFKPVLGDCDFV